MTHVDTALPFPEPLDTAALVGKVAELRRLMIEVAHRTGGAYLAQALSGIDLLAAMAYRFARGDGARPDHPDRDRVLLSPGHYALALYAVLADRGYFERDLLWTLKDDGSPLELATHRGTVPGVEASGGSLGQVLSLGVGMALAARRRGRAHRVFVMMSDGEQDEGQVWEAVASAAHYKLGNLVAAIDANGFQVDGPCSQVLDMEPLADKYRAFGWDPIECDGNDVPAVVAAFETLCAPGRRRPGILIGRTVRGRGISFMEGNPAFHYARLDPGLRDRAMADLEGGTDAV
jgi:transketolase